MQIYLLKTYSSIRIFNPWRRSRGTIQYGAVLSQALGDNTRLRLLNLMGDSGNLCVLFREDPGPGAAEDFAAPSVSAACRNCAGAARGEVDAALSHRDAAEHWRDAGAAADAWHGLGRIAPCKRTGRGYRRPAAVRRDLFHCKVLHDRPLWTASPQLRPDNDGEHTLCAGTDMRSACAEKAVVSRSVFDAMDFSGDGGWCW